jgi:2,3-dihydroxybenzoate decarboxylase
VREVNLKKIILEEHFLPPEFQMNPQVSRLLNPHIIEYVFPRLTGMEQERLDEMDKYGIEKQVLSLNAPGVQAETDTATAIKKAKHINDTLAEMVHRHPDRFAGFATLPLQDPQVAADELERAVTQLGFKGAMVNGHTNGEFLDEQKFWGVWERAEALDVPIYLHPGHALPGESNKFYEGYPQLLGAMWDWGFEVATQTLRLVLSGVFDAFPKSTLILGHMGEMLPYVLWRLDSRVKISATPTKIKKLPSQYIRENIVITTSGQFANEPLLCAIQALGADRVLFSVDYPYEYVHEGVEFIEAAPISIEDKEKICYRNAERLLKL